MAIYQYMRVSTKKQSNDRQEYVLKNRGIVVDKIYADKISGKAELTNERPELNKLKLEAKAGDVIYVESLSRLARDLKDAINICDYFIEKKVQVIILKENIDTNNKANYKLLIGIFGGIAEMERETINERINQKVAYLKDVKEKTGEIKTKSGKWFGREQITKKYIDEKYPRFKDYLNMAELGLITKKEMANMLKIGRTTLYDYLKVYNKKEEE